LPEPPPGRTERAAARQRRRPEARCKTVTKKKDQQGMITAAERTEAGNFTGPYKMSEKCFATFGSFIEKHCGIKMPPVKKTMLEGRLRKRLRLLGMNSYEQYADYVFGRDGSGSEMVQMIDAVTTNKTDFFREPSHFDYLVGTVLPAFMTRDRECGRAGLRLWSAGCSTGEEPYTLAMVLSDYAERNPQLSYSILATDLSTRVLAAARDAIYSEDKIYPVPMQMRRKYLMRSRDRASRLVRVVPALRQRIAFRRLNFMQADFGIANPMYVIFCRNVVIYFDRRRQERLLNKFCRHLGPGGYVFMGHSETLSGMDVPLVQVAPTVYKKTE